MVRRVAIGVAIAVAVCAALLIAGVLVFERSIIRPLTQDLPTEAQQELAFVGGLAAFVCLADEYEQTIADEVEDLAAFRFYTAGEGERCGGSLRAVVGCYREYRDALGMPIVWGNALEEIQRIVRMYERIRTILRNAHAIARAIPTYDDPSAEFKRRIVALTATLRNLSAIDLLLERDATEEQVEARGDAMIIAAAAWAEDMVGRFPAVVALAEVTEAVPVIGLLALREVVNDDVVDTALRQAKTYRYARTEGCLAGNDPATRLHEIIEAL
ncbi:hypothetical protein HY634_04550 [Candidatus Uhrbacteria bacterium]|nr:hypothetical protein [Candidatus Uhrbacteria bacterium]